MTLQIIPSGGGTATADSISIPQIDLAAYGVTDTEMVDDATGLARAVWGVLKAIQDFDTSSLLGFTKPANANVAVTSGVFNRTYSITVQRYIDFNSGNNGVVPIPTTGSNNGVGGFALTDVFPNAVKVSATDAVAASAILIPSADITLIQSDVNHGNIDITSGQDNRNLLGLIYEALTSQLDLRSTTVASAFTTLARGVSGAAGLVPATYIDSTNPTSGLVADNVSAGQVVLVNKTTTITIQTGEDLSNDTLDVNVVTS